MAKQKSPIVPVSVLTDAIRHRLTASFSRVFVEGEISGMTAPRSGHIYLTLKDEFAQISGVIWRTDAENVKFKLANGQKVLCGGYIDVYPARGTYQLIIRNIKPVGIGDIELAFRQLHAKLKAEGLFDPAKKRTLPRIPRSVAVVTSPTGAAIRDFLQVLSRRWSDIEVIVVPVKVQGLGSAEEIARAVDSISKLSDPPDVVVVTRGGGSKEDLWSFSEEIVCRAIAACEIPVISGVGHEIDVALSDLVADVRALTPSEAAERLVPDKAELTATLDSLGKQLADRLLGKIRQAEQELDYISRRTVLTKPMEIVDRRMELLRQIQSDFVRAAQHRLERSSNKLGEMAARMESINPLAVLSRGYSLTTKLNEVSENPQSGEILKSSEQIRKGDQVHTQLSNGSFVSRVEEIIEKG